MAAAGTASAARRALRRPALRQQHGEMVSMAAARATVGQHSGEPGHSGTESVAVAGTARAAWRAWRRPAQREQHDEHGGGRHGRQQHGEHSGGQSKDQQLGGGLGGDGRCESGDGIVGDARWSSSWRFRK
ncbi:hypothetical protein PF003_g3811 [Phytophthora fragariae]|nr:hypothetical protein PF003_g3811 [Phytophthora fragariae]